MDNPTGFFREEAVELLAALEGYLLDLEKNPANSDLINDVFRALHTLKGSGAMFGFNELAGFVHHIENVFDLVRKEELYLDRSLLNLTLEARDLMKFLIDPAVEVSPAARRRMAELTEAFSKLLPQKPILGDQPKSASENHPVLPAAEKPFDRKIKYRISFVPHPEFFTSDNNPLNIIAELKSLGDLKVTVDSDQVPDLASLSPEKCYLSWRFELTSENDVNAVKDVFIFVEDIADLKIDILTEPQISAANQGAANEERDKNPDTHSAAMAEEMLKSPCADSVSETTILAGIKVDASKLEKLIGLLGELVTIQSRLSQVADNRGDSELIAISQELDALTGELRDNALRLSMLPIESIFARLERFGASEAVALKRQVRFKFAGGDTELDKGVLSRLFEPLTFLIRFCIQNSHEDPASRMQNKKDVRGLISVSAWHSSGYVCVSVEDDGCLNQLSEEQVAVLEKSQRIIEELRGSLEARLNPGRNSAFVIKLPLNLAIIEGLMIRLADRLFVFPLSLVEECIELTLADQAKHYHKNVVMVRGQIVPYISLREKFAVSGELPAVQQVVIINQSGRRVGFVVDQVVGEYQTVIKSWGKFCSHTPGITGATILGDGNIALIVDLPVLIEEEKNYSVSEGHI